MKEKIKKGILAVATFIIVLGIVPFHIVSAEETGSIEITETATNTSPKQVIAGVKLALYKIADYDSTDDGQYKITDVFTGCGISAKDIIYAENLSNIAENLSKYAKDHSIEAQSVETSNENGYMKFSGLSDGIYLIRQVNADTDFKDRGYTYTEEPYIVAIPSLSSNGTEVRNVVCQPKGTLTRQDKKNTSLTVYKVWKDDNDKKGARPDTIKVGLYKDKKLEEEVSLSAGNNWMYAWSNLDTDSSWSVKELEVPSGYKSSVSNSDQVWEITNTYKPSAKPSSGGGSEKFKTGKKSKKVKTGDTSHIDFWLGLLTGSLIGIMILIYMKYRKREN